MPNARSRLLGPRLGLCALFCLLKPTPVAADLGNDRYAFAPAASRQRGVTLQASGTGFALKVRRAELERTDTLFLGLRVAANGAQPLLRARVGGEVIEQYLDEGAHGLRWLNLTSLQRALQVSERLEIEGVRIVISSRQASLRLFENQLPFAAGTLVLAAHPDDAEIAAFALYAQNAPHTRVVTVTAGNAGAATYRAQFDAQLASQYQFKGVLRVIDSVTVPWQGGVPPERCFNLGYFDARLAEMHAQKATPIREAYGQNSDVLPYRRANLHALLPLESRLNSWQNLVADLARLFSQLAPAVVVMPHPLLDSHPDHQFVAVAALEALEALGPTTRPINFLLYTNHAGDNLYPYGPAGSVMSLPPWPLPELPVQRLYALPVDRALQRRKLFALESMHDLRLSPDEQSRCGGEPPGIDSPRNPSTDYFRRAPRSEELFFSFDQAGVTALVRRFLSGEKK